MIVGVPRPRVALAGIIRSTDGVATKPASFCLLITVDGKCGKTIFTRTYEFIIFTSVNASFLLYLPDCDIHHIMIPFVHSILERDRKCDPP